MTTTARNFAPLLNRLIAGADLSASDTSWAMNLVMTGEATPAQVAAFVVALRAKGETPQEISGMAEAMLEHAHPLAISARAIDVVGTGGDRSGSVNISTMSSIVLAAAGATVVKHGNRAASSSCGTADVLEELGVVIDLPPSAVAECAEKVGIGFCFAPRFHPAMKHAAGPRREIGVPTAFNVLGPLTNPARPSAGLIGCADERMAPTMAEVFAERGASALVVRGDDGMDEITTTGGTTAWRVSGGTIGEHRIEPGELGIPLCTADDLRGGDAPVNAAVVRRLLAGEPGPVRDTVLLNAAGALVAHHDVPGDLTEALRDGFAEAARAIDSGAGADLLERWVEMSNRLR